jgi:hypothetical protein
VSRAKVPAAEVGMGAKRCAVHEKENSVAACRNCSKQLCKSCVMVTPLGNFCSSECSVLHREMKGQAGPGRRASGIGAKAFVVVLLLVAVAFGIHLAPPTTGKPFDVVGRLLSMAQAP